MNHRERVLSALRHKETDRVPVDLGGTYVTGIAVHAYRRLRSALAMPDTTIRISDMVQQLAEVEPEVLDRFGVDVLNLDSTLFDENGGADCWQSWNDPAGEIALIPRSLRVSEEAGNQYLYDGLSEPLAVRTPGCPYFEMIRTPFASATEPSDLDQFDWANWGKRDLNFLRERARRMREKSDRLVVGSFGAQLLEGGQGLMGYERFMMELALDTPLANGLIGRLVELYEKRLVEYLEALAPYVDVFCFFDDLGTQQAPQISLGMYRRMFLPGHRTLFSRVKRYPERYTFLHCCGAIRQFIPDLIDAGLDILNPVQTSAAGMDPAELKREYGKQLTFWGGGCDTQRILPTASPEEIRREVQSKMAILAPGGGFVFCPIHNIQMDVPTENILAMYDEALRFIYPDSK